MLPIRKHPRLHDFDYSSARGYFVTICTQNRKNIFSQAVGQGLAPAETDGLVKTKFGEIAEKQLISLEDRFKFLVVDSYVIMPNHIHAILILTSEHNNFRSEEAAGASPCPTEKQDMYYSITDIVCAYKSLTTRECKMNGFREKKLFQGSFYEHIIRNRYDYEETVKYIRNNPMRWRFDELYSQQ